MNNINIGQLEVNLDISEILNTISSGKSFEIDVRGRIYVDEPASNTIPIIYKSEESAVSNIVDAHTIIKTVFKEYKPQIIGASFKLKPVIAWQNVIGLNQGKMLYFDHQSDGVELFEDKELELIGWEATPLDITYREIAEFIEKNCEGVFVFYDNTIQFNGFVIVNDIERVREQVQKYILERIQDKIEQNELELEDDEIQESLSFFKVEY